MDVYWRLSGNLLSRTVFCLVEMLRMTSSLTSLPAPSTIVSQDVCQWHHFSPDCGGDHVIIMEHAHYGRMQLGTCDTENIGDYLGCSKNVLPMADKKCSGRHNCDVEIPDRDFESTEPCGQLKNYLSASYRCYPVQLADSPSCSSSCDVIKLTSSPGFLSSAVAVDSGCGSPDCPWLIEAGQGQVIKVTLYDFGYSSVDPTDGSVCRVYAVLKEELIMESKTICGGLHRKTDVYLSETNSVEVRMLLNQENERGHFLLHYQFMGCTDKTVPYGYSITRDVNKAIVTCDVTGTTSSLYCNSSDWLGQLPECSDRAGSSSTKENFEFELHWGYSSIVIIAIAVVIGACILTAGLLCYRRKSRPATQPPPPVNIEPLYEVTSSGLIMEAPFQRDPYVTGHPVSKVDTIRRLPMDFRNEYTHIWERPLPTPGKAELHHV